MRAGPTGKGIGPAPSRPGDETPRNFIFVYGTLMRGCANHACLAGQRFIGEARTPAGYRLHQLCGYPGMVVGESDPAGVPGEVWEVSDACLKQLHRLEGVDEGLYRFQPIDLQPPHDSLPVFTYLYLRNVLGRPVVAGKWREER